MARCMIANRALDSLRRRLEVYGAWNRLDLRTKLLGLIGAGAGAFALLSAVALITFRIAGVGGSL